MNTLIKDCSLIVALCASQLMFAVKDNKIENKKAWAQPAEINLPEKNTPLPAEPENNINPALQQANINVIDPFNVPEYPNQQPSIIPNNTKETKLNSDIEEEQGVFTKMYEYFADKTITALRILTALDAGKKDYLLHKTHQIERGINDIILKAKTTETTNAQPNSIDRLQAILRINQAQQNNLKKVFEGAKKHDLQVNDVTLKGTFEYCQGNTKQCIEYLQAVAKEAAELLKLDQEIQELVLQRNPKTQLAINNQEYQYFQNIIQKLSTTK